MNITQSTIARAIDHTPSFNRGKAYYNQRRVVKLDWTGKSSIAAVVAGSNANVYSLNAALHFDRNGLLSEVEGFCTCPVNYNCKHVVAALFQAMHSTGMNKSTTKNKTQKKASPTKVQQNLPANVKSWLNNLEALNKNTKTNKTGTNKTGTKKSNYAIFYIFNKDTIHLYQAYVKKDGKIGKQYKPLSSYGEAESFYKYANMEDSLVYGQLKYYKQYHHAASSSYIWPQGEELENFLKQIIATGRALYGSIQGPQMSWCENMDVDFNWKMKKDNTQYLAFSSQDRKRLAILRLGDPLAVDEDTGEIGIINSKLPLPVIDALAQSPSIPPEAVETVAKILSKHGKNMPRPIATQIETIKGLSPQGTLKLYAHTRSEYPETNWYRTGKKENVIYPCIQCNMKYGDYITTDMEMNPPSDIMIRTPEGMKVITRDRKKETKLLELLDEYADAFEGLKTENIGNLNSLPKAMTKSHYIFAGFGEDDMANRTHVIGFVYEALPALRKQGWEIETDPSWPVRLYEGDVQYHTAVESDGQDWFSFKLQIDVGEVQLDVTRVLLQLVDALPLDEFGQLDESIDLEIMLNEVYVYETLPNGDLVPIHCKELAGVLEAFLEVQGLTRFHLAEAGRISELAQALDGCGIAWKGSAELLELGKRLQALENIEDQEIPPQVNAQLRPYQKLGFSWLKSLSDTGFGGVLADDMGLGKTLQTITLLAYRHLQEKCTRPSLLVVPTSLIGNWQAECARYAPELKLLTLHGPNRSEHFDRIEEADLVITTYPLVNRDHEKLFAHEYEIAVLDEAQAVKNPASNVAKRIRDIKAGQRLALTGTPMENNLTELWALFDWLVPGLLGDRKNFAAEYRKPIENQGDKRKQRLLSQRVKPFLMRRTKEEVAEELPAKTIIDENITLNGKQAALYESVRTAMDERVRKALAEKGLGGSRITVLDALLKLRQVCCDPRLVKLDSARKVKESAKFTRLLELLEELMQEGRKVLVFSQFVEMLLLMEAEIVSKGWSYAILHGKTKDRTREIDSFQTGDAQIFLISLKSGGTGLNLTAADTVILYDPWWNPAVERQAMDRAHRIGQDKPVFVHRLYTSGTVESAIQEMQARKQALADALFEGTSEGPTGLTEEDLTALFSSSS